jgi:hypothetical protein
VHLLGPPIRLTDEPQDRKDASLRVLLSADGPLGDKPSFLESSASSCDRPSVSNCMGNEELKTPSATRQEDEIRHCSLKIPY